MKSVREHVKEKPWLGWVLFLFTMAVVFIFGLLVSSVMERRTEALFVNKAANEIAPLENRNEVCKLSP